MKDYKPNINALVNAARLEGIRLGLEAAWKTVSKHYWLSEATTLIGFLDPNTIAKEAQND